MTLFRTALLALLALASAPAHAEYKRTTLGIDRAASQNTISIDIGTSAVNWLPLFSFDGTSIRLNAGVITGALQTSALGAGVQAALGNSASGVGGFALVGGSVTVGNCLKWAGIGIQDAGIVCAGNASGGPALVNGAITAGNCLKWSSGGIQDAGPCAGNQTLVNVRQTVLSGPIFSDGAPTFIPSTSATLSIATQGLMSGDTALVVTAAQGYNASGQIDYVTRLTSDVTWSGLAPNAVNFLWINAQTGATGSTTLAPIYQQYGAVSTANGQFTFNIVSMIGYMGNGATAPATPIVFVGEAVTNASSVTSAIAYAYNGVYFTRQSFAWTTANTATNFNHNLGVTPRRWSARAEVTAAGAAGGWAIGDVVDVITDWGNYQRGIAFGEQGRNAIVAAMGASSPMVPSKTGGQGAAINASFGNIQLLVERGW